MPSGQSVRLLSQSGCSVSQAAQSGELFYHVNQIGSVTLGHAGSLVVYGGCLIGNFLAAIISMIVQGLIL